MYLQHVFFLNATYKIGFKWLAPLHDYITLADEKKWALVVSGTTCSTELLMQGTLLRLFANILIVLTSLTHCKLWWLWVNLGQSNHVTVHCISILVFSFSFALWWQCFAHFCYEVYVTLEAIFSAIHFCYFCQLKIFLFLKHHTCFFSYWHDKVYMQLWLKHTCF